MAGFTICAAVVLEPAVRLIERVDDGEGACPVAIGLNMNAVARRNTDSGQRIAAPTAWRAAA
ncbi:hypothetical protein DC429_16415 [Arthrobacter sp. TPD3018]|nr:hypothetical protein DC425_16320 [Sphingomonas sp. TPD3009]PVE52594.1 hypothetical protein DC429_16415 [Arthrobacter sp. TPD3018]PVE80721.1 hypothetical protein DC431_15805 [Sphingomonas melonis]